MEKLSQVDTFNFEANENVGKESQFQIALKSSIPSNMEDIQKQFQLNIARNILKRIEAIREISIDISIIIRSRKEKAMVQTIKEVNKMALQPYLLQILSDEDLKQKINLDRFRFLKEQLNKNLNVDHQFMLVKELANEFSYIKDAIGQRRKSIKDSIIPEQSKKNQLKTLDKLVTINSKFSKKLQINDPLLKDLSSQYVPTEIIDKLIDYASNKNEKLKQIYKEIQNIDKPLPAINKDKLQFRQFPNFTQTSLVFYNQKWPNTYEKIPLYKSINREQYEKIWEKKLESNKNYMNEFIQKIKQTDPALSQQFVYKIKTDSNQWNSYLTTKKGERTSHSELMIISEIQNKFKNEAQTLNLMEKCSKFIILCAGYLQMCIVCGSLLFQFLNQLQQKYGKTCQIWYSYEQPYSQQNVNLPWRFQLIRSIKNYRVDTAQILAHLKNLKVSKQRKTYADIFKYSYDAPGLLIILQALHEYAQKQK